MGKTYRRDSDRKFKNFPKDKSNSKKLKQGQDELKVKKHLNKYNEDVDNEY